MIDLEFVLSVAVAVAAVAAAAICAEVVRSLAVYNRGDLKRLPSPPGSVLFGHFRDFMQPNFHRVLSNWVRQCGAIYRQPSAVAQVLSNIELPTCPGEGIVTVVVGP